MKFIPILATLVMTGFNQRGAGQGCQIYGRGRSFEGPRRLFVGPPKMGNVIIFYNNLRLDMFLYYNIII